MGKKALQKSLLNQTTFQLHQLELIDNSAYGDIFLHSYEIHMLLLWLVAGIGCVGCGLKHEGDTQT